VLDTLFQALIRYASPVLVFTAEEVWGTRFPERGSIHLQTFHALPGGWRDEALGAKFAELRALRMAVTEAVEPLRREKVLGSSLEAVVRVPEGAAAGATGAELAELFITATVSRAQGESVSVTRTEDAKCGRCWRHLPDVAEDGGLCGRCETVVAAVDASADAAGA